MAACGRAAGARYWKHTRFAHARPFFKQINVEDVEGILMILMSQRAGYVAMCLLGRNIELNDMSGTCEARTLVWGDALPEELWPGRRELQFFRSFETLSFKYFCSTCCRDSIISLLWDRWWLLVLSIQKSATSDLLWFRNHVFDLGLFDVNVGGVGDSLRRGFSSWCDLSHYWWLSATAAEESKLKHQSQREPAWTMILEI